MATEVIQNRVQTGGAPAAIGPYSQAIVANGMVFCTGQVAIDPETNQLVQVDCIAIVPSLVDSIQVVEARESQSTYDLDLDRDF